MDRCGAWRTRQPLLYTGSRRIARVRFDARWAGYVYGELLYEKRNGYDGMPTDDCCDFQRCRSFLVDVSERSLLLVRLVHKCTRSLPTINPAGTGFTQTVSFLVHPDKVPSQREATADADGIADHDGEESSLIDGCLIGEE